MVDTHHLTNATASTTRSKETNSQIILDVNHLVKNMTYPGVKIRGSRKDVEETTHLPKIRKPREHRRDVGDAAFQPARRFR